MEAEAVKLIQDSNAELAQTVNSLAEPFAKFVSPPDWTIHDVEKYGPTRRRFRADYVTDNLPDWAAYVTDHDGEDNVHVFVQPADMTAMAIFNIGDVDTPGHADDRALLKLGRTAAYLALKQIAHANLSQGDLLDWLDDHNEQVTAFLNSMGEEIPRPTALQALHVFNADKVHAVTSVQHDVRRELGDLERIEVRDAVVFPSRFVFRFVPAVGLPFAEAVVKITPTIIATREGMERKPPTFRLRVIGLDAFNETLGETFKQCVAEILSNDDVSVRIGTWSPGA